MKHFLKTNSKWDYWKQKTILSDVRQSTTKKILATITAIVCALALALIIACSVCNAWPKFGPILGSIFSSGFVSINAVNSLISQMAILLVAGLAFIFAYKAGLFNIGISGQMVWAGTMGLLITHLRPAGPGGNQIVILIVCILSGAAIAAISGALKAFLNVNEVVSSIMLNWIIYYMSILILSTSGIKTDSSGLATDLPDASLILKSSIGGHEYSMIPLIIIGVILVVGVVIVLNYTVFGKKLKVTGLSRTGALASGYNVKANMIIAMAISGAIAGILGAMVYCGFSPQMPTTAAAKAIPQEGFNGISVGLIAMCSPVAALPISLFFSMVQTSVSALQTYGIDNHIGQVIFGIVVYGAAMISLFLNLKPYWLTTGIFKGKNYSRIKRERNLSNIELLELSNDYNEQLRKYYLYNIKQAKIRNSLKLTWIMKLKMKFASLRYQIVLIRSKIRIKANKHRDLYSRKYYYRRDMTHIIVKKGKLQIDPEYQYRGGIWVRVTDKNLNDPKLVALIENATKVKPDAEFMKVLKGHYKDVLAHPFDDKELALIPLLSYLQNLRSGLAFRYDIAVQNELDRLTLVSTEQWAKGLGLPAIKNQQQYEKARLAFIKAWKKVSDEINVHYDAMLKEYAYSKKADKDMIFTVTDIKFDPSLIEQNFLKYLNQEIHGAADDIEKPLIMSGAYYEKKLEREEY